MLFPCNAHAPAAVRQGTVFNGIGRKLVDDKRYGPSGEKFEATNIIGRVLDPEKLKDVLEGETVYIKEVR